MKLLFDQNLSPRLVATLADLYPDSIHIASVGLDRSEDRDLIAFAQEGGFAIVTKDADFDDLRLVLDTTPRIIWIRRGNCTTREIERALREHVQAIRAFETDPDATLLALR